VKKWEGNPTAQADFAWQAVLPCNLDPERLGGSLALPCPLFLVFFHPFPFFKGGIASALAKSGHGLPHCGGNIVFFATVSLAWSGK
jgi:hypothetical protein